MDNLETLWIPCGDTGLEFKQYIKDQGDRAELKAIDGKNRWVIEGEDGVKRIARPKNKETYEHWCGLPKENE